MTVEASWRVYLNLCDMDDAPEELVGAMEQAAVACDVERSALVADLPRRARAAELSLDAATTRVRSATSVEQRDRELAHQASVVCEVVRLHRLVEALSL